jgi:hypothetical protein
LYCGVKLYIFETVSAETPMSATQVATALKLDPAHTYRLMRALSSLNLLRESADKNFVLTSEGAVLKAEHPQTLRGVVLMEEGPVHYALWKHLPDIIRDGRQDAFVREFGHPAFEHTIQDEDYGQLFDNAMSSYSATQTLWALQALDGFEEMGSIKTLCDVGGGQGHLLCSLLQKYKDIEQGIVLEIPAVVNGQEKPKWAAAMKVEDRVSYREGNAFDNVEEADAVIMKMVIHCCNNEECVQILSNCLAAVPQGGFVMIVDHVVPDNNEPHFSKFLDIDMMCWGTGKERTEAEFEDLLTQAGWAFVRTYYPPEKNMGVVVGVKK